MGRGEAKGESSGEGRGCWDTCPLDEGLSGSFLSPLRALVDNGVWVDHLSFVLKERYRLFFASVLCPPPALISS